MLINLLAASLVGTLGLVPAGPVPVPGVLGARTVHVLPAPIFLEGVEVGALHDPLQNAALDTSLRRDIERSLSRRGYTLADSDADLVVAYYVSLPAPDDVTDWTRLYQWRPNWLRAAGAASVDLTPTEYQEGAVVIDLIDARTNELLWRGHAVAPPANDGLVYTRRLRGTVSQIVTRFPVPAPQLD